MARFVAIYSRPDDERKFLEHYFQVHVPLAKKLPGLVSYCVSEGAIETRSTGDAPFMIASLRFRNLEDLNVAFASDMGLNCAADRKILAPKADDAKLYIFEEYEL
jgi:uncharacterized protein (TIGR02118 family)